MGAGCTSYGAVDLRGTFGASHLFGPRGSLDALGSSDNFFMYRDFSDSVRTKRCRLATYSYPNLFGAADRVCGERALRLEEGKTNPSNNDNHELVRVSFAYSRETRPPSRIQRQRCAGDIKVPPHWTNLAPQCAGLYLVADNGLERDPNSRQERERHVQILALKRHYRIHGGHRVGRFANR